MSITAIFAVTMILFAVVPPEIFTEIYFSLKVPVGEMFFYICWANAFLYAGIIAVRPFFSRQRHVSTLEDDKRDLHFMEFLGYSSFGLAMFSYVIYFGMSGVSFADIAQGFSGEIGASYALRGELENIPGVTSLMNVAPWWFAYIAFKKFVAGRRLTRIEIILSSVLFALVTLRGLAAFERRAIIDLFIPAAVLVIMRKTDWTPGARKFVATLPVTAVVFVIVLFMFAEYFKTWINYYQLYSDMPFFEWSMVRLAGYYATAVNNGIMGFQDGLSTGGATTLSGLYKLPLIAELFALGDLRDEMVTQYKFLLIRLANLEFNNPGGAVSAFLDFGLWGGALFLFIHGVIFSWIYLSARKGSLVFTLLYALVFASALEITRVWFFGSPFGLLNLAFVPAMAGLYKLLPRKATPMPRRTRIEPRPEPAD